MRIATFLFILFSLFFLVINTPAHWVYNKFLKPELVNLPIAITQPKGSLFNGKTQIASIPSRLPIQVFIPNLEWQWKPLALLTGSFIFRLKTDAIELAGKSLGDYVADVGVGFGGYIIHITDNNTLLQVDVKVNLNQRPRQAIGSIKLRKEDNEIANLLKTLPAINPDGNFVLNF